MNYTHVNKDNKCSAGKQPADYERLQWTINRSVICRSSKIKSRLKKQRNKKKGTGQFQNLKWFLCLPFLPCFPRVSLHQSSTNILPQMIYQMFAKAEVSTGSYTLSMTLCGNYSQLNKNIEQSLYQKVEEIIVPLFWKAQHWIHFLYRRLN